MKNEHQERVPPEAANLLISTAIESKLNKDADYVIKLNYYHPSDITFKNKSFPKYSASVYNDGDSKVKAAKAFRRKSEITSKADKEERKDNQLSKLSLKDKIEYERTQENKREEIKQKIKALKEDIKNLYCEYDIQSKIFENLKLEIDILSNYKSYLKKEISTNKANKKGMNETHSNNNAGNMHEKKNILYQGLIGHSHKLKNTREQKEMSLIGVTFERKKLKERISALNDLLIEAKKDYGAINSELYIYYHQLLSEGIDCRKDGLIWIMKRIWSLGGNVILSYFPCFVDKTTIDFLFALAAKSVHLDDVRNQIEHIKGDNDKQVVIFKPEEKEKETKTKPKANYSFFLSRNKAKNALDDGNNKESQHDSLNINNKANNSCMSYLCNSLSSRLNSSLKYLSNKSQKTILCHLSQLSKEEKRTFGAANKRKRNSTKSQELEDYFIKLTKEIGSMRRKELNRINKEFYLNDYSRRYSIKQEIMIALIIGQELASIEMKRAKIEQKEYFQIMKILKNKVQIPPELQYSFSSRESCMSININ